MVVLRCTQKLLARLKQADKLAAVESTTRLGDWYGNILQIGRRQHLLFISERSRLPVVIPIHEGKGLASVFPDAVCEVLGHVGVGGADIAACAARKLDQSAARKVDHSRGVHSTRFETATVRLPLPGLHDSVSRPRPASARRQRRHDASDEHGPHAGVSWLRRLRMR